MEKVLKDFHEETDLKEIKKDKIMEEAPKPLAFYQEACYKETESGDIKEDTPKLNSKAKRRGGYVKRRKSDLRGKKKSALSKTAQQKKKKAREESLGNSILIARKRQYDRLTKKRGLQVV